MSCIFYVWIAVICSLRWFPEWHHSYFLRSPFVWNMGWYFSIRFACMLTAAFAVFTDRHGLEFLAGAAWAHSRKRFQMLQTHPWLFISIGLILVITGFPLETTSPFLIVGNFTCWQLWSCRFWFSTMALSAHRYALACTTLFGGCGRCLVQPLPVAPNFADRLWRSTFSHSRTGQPLVAAILLCMPFGHGANFAALVPLGRKTRFEVIANRGNAWSHCWTHCLAHQNDLHKAPEPFLPSITWPLS